MADEPVGQTISWPILEKHLRMLTAQAYGRLESAEGVEITKVQGELRLLKKLMNLPETLALLDEEDRRAAAEKK
jgi:hypothetical protein